MMFRHSIELIDILDTEKKLDNLMNHIWENY